MHKRDILINIVKELFPQYKNIQADYYWAAAFGGTHDGLPILKEDEKIHNLFYALRMEVMELYMEWSLPNYLSSYLQIKKVKIFLYLIDRKR